MNTVLFTSVWAWAALVAIVLLLALYRLLYTRGMYTVLHVRRSELSLIPEQILHDRRLERIDNWGQILTVDALIFGLLLAIVYLYVNVGPVAWPDPYPTF
jgi:hypothetical protein